MNDNFFGELTEAEYKSKSYRPVKRSNKLADYVGIKYESRGRDLKTGVDCWGLSRYVCRYCYGITLPSLKHKYASASDYDEMHKSFIHSVDSFIEVDTPQRGDIVVFRIGGVPCHVGVYVGSNEFIHSLMGHNSAIENLNSITWQHRIAGFYRAP